MDLASIAAEQGGVFTRAQARAAGYSSWQVKKRLDDGQWVVVMGRALAAASTVLGVDGQLWAAYLAAGRGTVVSHLSAGRLHGLGKWSPHPWITVPSARHTHLAGVRVVRAEVDTGDIDLIGGMLVTDRERTLADCLCVLSFKRAQDLLDRALQKRWITVASLAARTQRQYCQHGAPQLRALLRRATSGARFEAERKLHSLLRRAGIREWEANVEIRDPYGQLVAVADVLFPRLGLVIEVDGRAWHSADERFQRDRDRQNALVTTGYEVLRFTWYDLVERPAYVLLTVRNKIAALSRR